MKTTWNMHTTFAIALTSAGLDGGAVENAINAHRASAAVVDSSDPKSGGAKYKVKTVGTGDMKRKEVHVTEAESYRITYGHGGSAPARFMAFHDSIVALWSKQGTPADVAPLAALLPSDLVLWLTSKDGFKAKAPEVKPTEPAPEPSRTVTPEATKANGKGKGKRAVTPESTPATV